MEQEAHSVMCAQHTFGKIRRARSSCPGVPPRARCQLQNYKPAGKVQGAFYDAEGQAQPILHEVHAAAERHAKAEEERANKRSEAPECSRRWSQNSGMLLQEPPISSNQLITDAA